MHKIYIRKYGSFIRSIHQIIHKISSRTTVLNIGNKKKNVSRATNQLIRMIFKGSCDTEPQLYHYKNEIENGYFNCNSI